MTRRKRQKPAELEATIASQHTSLNILRDAKNDLIMVAAERERANLAESKLAAVERENEGLRKDAERFAALERMAARCDELKLLAPSEHAGDPKTWLIAADLEHWEGQTLRAAVDAAIQSAERGEG